MKIALVISSLNAGGAERVLTKLANYWSTQEHDISLITLAPLDSKPFYTLDLKVNLIQLNQSQDTSSLALRLRHILKRIFCLRKTLIGIQPDIVISFVDIMNLTTLISSIGLQIPVIVSERIDPNFHEIPSLYKKMRPFLYRLAKNIIVQTKSAASYFEPRLRDNIEIIPNPVEAVKNTYIVRPIPQSIITVGRLDRQKDHETLINAFSFLIKKHPYLKLTIYGEGPERQNLQTLIGSLKLEQYISLPGTASNIQQKFQEADLFVFPSLYEGFPNALCEAMANGLPVIASNCSGNIDIIRDGIDGHIFPVGDVAKLTSIMDELLNDFNARKHFSETAQTISERFHPNHIFEMWDQVIDNATKGKDSLS